MARFDIDFPDNLFGGLEDIFETAAPKMIDAALPVYRDAVGDSLKKSISSAPEDVKRQTGALVRSLSIKKAERTKTDAYAGVVTFTGASKTTACKGKTGKEEPFRNFQKALALEFGTTRGQAARPFLQRATDSCEKEVIETMQDIFNREAGK